MLKKEWKKILKNPLMIIVMAAIILIPSIYTTLFLSSMWDPYGHLDNLPVAVVNLDQPVTYDGRELAVGSELVENLKENKELDFHFTDREDAEEGIHSGRYYMVITIPENFSHNASTLMDEHPEKMELKYSTNPGTNYIASKLSSTALSKIETKIADEVTRTYAETVFDQLNEIGNGLDKGADGANQITDGTDKLIEGNGKIHDNLEVLAESTLTFRDGSRTLEMGLAEYTDGVEKLADGAAELKDGSSKLSDGSGKLRDGASDLDKGASDLKSGVSELNDGASELEKGGRDLYDGSRKLSNGASDLYAGTKTLHKSMNELKAGSSTLSKGASDLKAGISNYTGGVNSLKSGAEQLSGLRSLDKVYKGIVSIKTLVNDGAGGNPSLKDAADQLAGGLGAIDAQLSRLTGSGSYGRVSVMSVDEAADDWGKAAETHVNGNEGNDKGSLSGGTDGTADESGSGHLSGSGSSYGEDNAYGTGSSTSGGAANSGDTAGSTGQQASGSGLNGTDGAGADAPGSSDGSANGSSGGIIGSAGSSAGSVDGLAGNGAGNMSGSTGSGAGSMDGSAGNGAGNMSGSTGSGAGGGYGSNGVFIDYDTLRSLSASIHSAYLAAEAISQGTDALSAGLAELENSTRAFPAAAIGMQTMLDGFETLTQNNAALTAGAAQLDAGALTLDKGAGKLSEGAVTLMSGAEELDKGSSDLMNGAAALKDGIKRLADGIRKLLDGVFDLKDGTSALLSGAVELDDGAKALDDGMTTLKDGADELVSNNGKLLDGAGELTSGADKISDGAGKLADGSSELQDGLYELKDGSIVLADSLFDGAAEIHENEAGDGTLDMFSSPVTSTETQVSKVADNGSAMSAYMMCVGLWVGALAFCLMYPLTKYEGRMKNGFCWWFSKASVAYPLAILMAFVMLHALQYFCGFAPADYSKTAAVACMAACAFMAIMYFFNVAFGKVGSFAMLVFMVIQLAGSAGTYPIELSAGFVEKIHYLLPFSYVVEAFRMGICGEGSIEHSLGVLAAWTAVFSILTIILFMLRSRRIKEGKENLYDVLEHAGLA